MKVRDTVLFWFFFFPVRICKISLKLNYLCTIILPKRWIKMNIWSQREQSVMTFLVLNLLMAIWFHQTAIMFMVLLDNSLMKRPHRAFNWACCSKNGQLLGQPRELRNLFSQFLKTSEKGDCTISLGKLFSCLIGHMGKSFSFYSIENLHYSISLLSCPFQLFWALYLQSSSHSIPSIHFLNETKGNQNLVSYSLGPVPSYSPLHSSQDLQVHWFMGTKIAVDDTACRIANHFFSVNSRSSFASFLIGPLGTSAKRQSLILSRNFSDCSISYCCSSRKCQELKYPIKSRVSNPRTFLSCLKKALVTFLPCSGGL